MSLDQCEQTNQISPALLRRICREKGGYGTPSLNEKLYLHFRNLTRIENLDEYTGVRCLWLESNGLCTSFIYSFSYDCLTEYFFPLNESTRQRLEILRD